jgi:hypothetical protein
MADSYLGGAGPAGGSLGALSLTGLITAIQQNGQQLNSILAAIKAIPGILSPTYATGGWTPVVTFGGSTTGITYGTQTGTWTQLGREIICRFKIVLTNVGSATGAVTLTGLPFASNADATNSGAGGIILAFAAMATISGAPLLQVGPSSSSVTLLTAGAAATAALTNSNFTNTTTIQGQFSYFT